jgi:hypothetical protein
MTLTSFGQDKKRPETGPEQGFHRLAFARTLNVYGAFNARHHPPAARGRRFYCKAAVTDFYGRSLSDACGGIPVYENIAVPLRKRIAAPVHERVAVPVPVGEPSPLRRPRTEVLIMVLRLCHAPGW